MVAPDRDRLRRAFRIERRETSPTPADGDVPPAERDVRALLQERLARLPRRERIELPPASEPVGDGRPWRREIRYPLSFHHGAVELGGMRDLDGERLGALAKDPTFSTVTAGQCLFLDTETTGLAGGAGTTVFAYGLAFLRGDELVLEQLFLRDYGEEPAMLRHVAARLHEFPVPVTFVGKSYDRHRIAARLAVHKLRAPVLTDRHLDLYHLVRRAHGKALPDARLRTVEDRLLGVRRDDDLPGSEAPAAFLDWIRDGTGRVDRVLEHNRLDVLSLVALLGVLAGRR